MLELLMRWIARGWSPVFGADRVPAIDPDGADGGPMIDPDGTS